MPVSYDDYFKKKKKQQEEDETERLIQEYLRTYKKDNTKKTTVAPIKKKQKWYEGWVDTGAFKDGYQIGDGLKTVGGTALNVGVNLLRGSAQAGEGLGKLIGGGIAEVSDLLGNDELADNLRSKLAGENEAYNKFQEKFFLSSNFNKVSDKLDRVSVTGEKTDDLTASVGQLLSASATGTVGANAIMFGSTAGHELENAYRSGATSGEAWGSALISGASEIIFEKLSGGIKLGGKTIDEGVKKKLSDVIANKTVSTLTKFGLDVVGEGTEEVLTEVASNIGRKLTYEDEKTWSEVLASDEALDNYVQAFIGGALMGGGFQAGRVTNSLKTGRDYDTGFSANEQKVLDSVKNQRTTEIQKERAVEERVKKVIAEREGTFGTLSETEKKNITNKIKEQLDNGELDYSTSKLTKKEIAKIEKEVQEDLAKGNIDIDAIESTLSSEKTAQIKELQTQLDKTTNPEKKAEIQAQINELQSVKASEMSEILKKDYRLQPSYNEAIRKTQKFTYEAQDTDSEYKKALAEDFSRIANNTTKSHETFETISKIAEDKQTSYGVINNEQLKELGYDVEGKDVNGLVRVNKDGTQKVLINIDSSKAINRIVGHETTHLLEGTNEYKELQQMVKEYATTKGEYDTRLKDLTKLYEGTNANIENELTADLVGDYLFTDADFVNSLSVQKPNIFQKIFNEIKHLYKLATAGSKEARQLEKVKKAFEDAYRKNGQQTKQQSIADNKKLYDYAKENKMLVSATDNLAEILESGVFDAKRTSVGSYDKGTAISEYGKYKVHLKPEALDYVDKMYKGDGGTRSEFVKENKETFANVEELINNHPQTSTGQATYDELTFKNDIPTDLIEKVEIPEETDQSVIDMLESKGIPYEFYTPKQKSNTNEDSLLSMFGKKAQKQPTVEKPSEGLTKEQQEYFKDSVVRDENGDLMVMYHGTSSGGHTVFDTYGSKYGLFGQGSYFTNDRSVAESYTEKGKGKNPQIYETYLNITNPIDMDAQADAEAWKKVLPDADFPASGTNEDFYRAMEEYYRDAEYSKWEASEEIIDVIQGMGYDGITHIGGGRFNKADDTRHRVYIAFESNQIKNVDNLNPTDDADIRYSLSEKGTLVDNKGNEVTLEASDTGTHGTLMAIHNLTKDKMKGIIELGGFPVPSIAVTNNYTSNANFGEISVLFDKNTIDPELNEANKVYSRDAYTTRIPNIANKINESGLQQVSENTGLETWDLKDRFRETTLENAVEDIKRNENILDRYLEQKGIEVEPIYRDFRGLTSLSQRALQRFINEHQDLLNMDYTDRMSFSIYEKYYKDVHDLFVDEAVETTNGKATREQAEALYGEYPGFNHWDYFLRDLTAVQELEGSQQLDEYATKDAKEKAVDINSKEYNDFVRDLISPMFGDKYVRNNKDYYTASGNPRSFDQRYEAFTLENIVKIMNENKGTGQEGGFFTGIGELAGDSSKRFTSIEDIKNNEHLLETQNREEYQAVLDKYSEEMRDINSDILQQYGDLDTDSYIWKDKSISETMKSIARKVADGKKVNTKSVISQYEKNYIKVNEEQAQRTLDLINNIANLPTDYFEAKPQRAVGLDEVQAIVIPNTTSTEFKQQLQDAGLRYYEYDPNIEGDRQRVINQFDDLKFSLSNQNQDIAPVRGDIFGSDIKYDASQTEVPLDIAPFRKPFELGYIPKDPTRAESYDFDDPVQDYFNKFIPDNAVQTAQEQPKSKLRRMADTFKGQFVNRNVEIDNLARESGNKNIKFAGDMYNNVAGEIETDVNTAQTNMEGKAIGKSIKQIFQPSKDAGLYEAFNDYLIQKSNIERHKQGKGSVIPASTSQQLVMEYEKSYPKFKTWANDVYQYNRNILNNEVEAGLVSEDLASFLTNDIYPSYVPFYEVQDTSRYFNDRGELKPVNVLKRAKGGASKIAHIEESMIKQTYAYKRAIRQNQLYQQIVGTLDSEVSIGADVRTDPTQLDESLYVDENGNKYLTAYVKGEQKSVRITDELYNSLKNESEQRIRDLEERYSLISKPLQKVSEIRRNLLTTWSPSFVITNPLKDIQDAVFNSKYTKDMLKNYPGAFKELAMGNTDTVKQFLALYGSGNTMGEFDIEQGKVKNQKNIKFLSKIPQINNIVELAPRYAEFKASLENGTSVNEAMYNAREITTNFGRGGTITKALNRNGFTFLNASVQGMDKFIRNFSGENGAKGVVGSIAKAFIFGVAPALLNAMFFDDDEEYEALPDYIKDNYYLIKTGDGEFVRIPKGRMISVFGSAGRRTLEFAQGNEDAYEGFLKNAYSQTGVSNPLTNNVFSPLIQAYGSENGEAWYGGDLVPSRLQDKPAEEQYDETTDEFSKWLGEKLKISPYKLNYVIDQYSGGIGDLVLPVITEEASSDGSLLAPLKDKFTANSTSDNKYVSEIYTLKDELTITANGSKATEEDKLKSKYIASVTSEMGKLYGERREVQNDESLTKAEKYEKAQAIKQEINKLAEDGLSKYENVSAMSNYATAGDKEYYLNTKNQWQKIDNDELEDLDSMGMTNLEKNSYFKTKNEISLIVSDYKEDREELDDIDKDAISMLSSEKKRNIINQIINSGLTDDEKAYLYDKYYSSDKTLDTVLNAGIDFNTYLDFASQEFEADYYTNGKIVTNSKKNKVINYVNSLDLSVPQKAILIRQQYSSFKRYNKQIVEYVGGLNITYEEKVALLENLDMVVDANGNVRWK